MAEISNPRRILAVSLDESAQHLSAVVKDLTGAAPEPASTSLAGTTHDLPIKTPYYTATVPVWLDLIADPADWAASFLSDEAKEVLAILGGLVLVFALPAPADAPAAARTADLIRRVGAVVKDGLGGWAWDGVGLAVGVGEGTADQWDDLSADAGLEFVQVRRAGAKDEGRNEYGEKNGIPRVREALESNDWDQLDAGDALSDFGDFKDGEDDDSAEPDKSLDPESLDFGFDRADFEGMRKAIWGLVGNDDGAQDAPPPAGTSASKDPPAGAGIQASKDAPAAAAAAADAQNDEDQVAKVEMMMRKLQATREAGEGLTPEQRRRMAARAVEEVMREL